MPDKTTIEVQNPHPRLSSTQGTRIGAWLATDTFPNGEVDPVIYRNMLRLVGVKDADLPSEALLRTYPEVQSSAPKQRFAGENDVQIGRTWLEIPPTRISVDTISASEVLPSLRSPTSTIVKSGRSQIRVDMTVIFPDVESMNNELRELLAQFRLSPVLPLRSRYVANAVIQRTLPERKDTTIVETDADQEIRQLKEANVKDQENLRRELEVINALTRDVPDNEPIQRLVTALQTLSDEGPDARVQDGDRNDQQAAEQQFLGELADPPDKNVLKAISDIRGLIDSTNKLAQDQQLGPRFFNAFTSTLQVFNRIKRRALKIMRLRQQEQSRQSGVPDFGEIVPVILNQLSISTIEDFPETVMVNISLMYFNHAPYSQYFEMKDHAGDPTTEINDCPWFTRYIKSAVGEQAEDQSDPANRFKGRRFLKPIEGGLRGHIGFRYPTTNLKQVDQLEYMGLSGLRTTPSISVEMKGNSKRFVNKFETPVILDGSIGYVTEYKDFFVESRDPNIVVQSTAVSLVNRIAVQPILGSVYPTAQYIGGMNARIHMRVSVQGETQEEHDEALSALLTIKRETERVSVMYGGRARRDNKVFISNDLINLVGVRSIQFEDMKIETKGPQHSEVNISMIEYTASQNEREALTNVSGTTIDQIRVLLEWGSSKSKSVIDSWNNVSQLGTSDERRIRDGLPLRSRPKERPIKPFLQLEYRRDAPADLSLLPPLLYRDAIGHLDLVGNRSASTDIYRLMSDPIFRREASRIRRAWLDLGEDNDSSRVSSGRLDQLSNEYTAILSAIAGEDLPDDLGKRIEQRARARAAIRIAPNIAASFGVRANAPEVFGPARIQQLPSARRREAEIYRILLSMVSIGAAIRSEQAVKEALTSMLSQPSTGLRNFDPNLQERRDTIANRFPNLTFTSNTFRNAREMQRLTIELDQSIAALRRQLETVQTPGSRGARALSLLESMYGSTTKNIGGYDDLEASAKKNLNLVFPTVVSYDVVRAAVLKHPGLISRLKAVAETTAREFNEVVDDYAALVLLNWSGLELEAFGHKAFVPFKDEGLIFPSDVDNPDFKPYVLQVYEELLAKIPVTRHNTVPVAVATVPTHEDLQAAYDAVIYARNAFPDFDRLLRSESDRHNSASVFTDFYLPTYGEMFVEVWAALEARGGGFSIESSLNDATTANKRIIRKFVPTYRDLGVKPPDDKFPEDFARELDHEVEPTFFWYHTRTNQELVEALNPGPISVSQGQNNRKPVRDPNATRIVVDSSGVPRALQVGEDTSKPNHAPAVRQSIQSIGSINTSSAEHASRILDDSLRSKKDDVFSMSRAYPGFQLYFLEPGNPSLRIMDDLYGYNSVLSVKVHRHKFFPDTLEVALVNVSGTLDDMENRTDVRLANEIQNNAARSDVEGVLGADPLAENIRRLQTNIAPRVAKELRDPITGNPAQIDNLFLREGTQVVLKMGYSNRAAEMETVFTGQIAEIVRGDVIKFVAQSYAVELTIPVNHEKVTGAVNAISLPLLERAPIHFGALELDNAEFRKDPTNKRSRPGVDADVLLFTRRLDNVFLGNTAQNYEWRVPNKIGLELIHEVTRHFPGVVAGVRPYDNHATLFVGYPSTPYRYTDSGLQDELRNSVRPTSGSYRVFDRRSDTEAELQQIIRESLALMRRWRGGRANLDFELNVPRRSQSPEFKEWYEDFFQKNIDYAKAWIGDLAEDNVRLDSSSDYQSYWMKLKDLLGYDRATTVLMILLNDLHAKTETDYIDYTPLFLGVADGQTLDNSIATLASGVASVLSVGGRIVDIVATDIVGGDTELRRTLLGNAFTSTSAWESMLLQLLRPIDADFTQLKQTLFREDANMVSVDNIEIRNWKASARRLAIFALSIREFVRLFTTWLENEIGRNVNDPVVKRVNEGRVVDILKKKPFKKGYKPFRQFHWLDSTHHIMKNDIRASTDRMSNTVQVKYPESADAVNSPDDDGFVTQKSDIKWKIKEIAYHDKLRFQDQKVQLVTEINASDEHRAEATGLSNLAQSIGQMYQGELVIQGDARIEPYDVLFLFDYYNMVFGPVEVESVTHIMLSDTGFATVITPKALVIAGSSADLKQVQDEALIASKYVGQVNVKVSDPLVRTRSEYQKTYIEQAIDGVKNTFGVREQTKSSNHPNLDILPLTYNGRPWIAGLRGPDSNWFALDVDSRWEFWDRGAAIIAKSRLFAGTPSDAGR